MPDAVPAASPAAATDTGNTTPGEAKAAAPAVAEKVAAPATTTPDAKQEVKTEAPKFKVKIDGKEMEVTQEELLKGYQLEASARKRQQEAVEARKQADGILAAAKAGDYEALRTAGLSDQEIEQLSIKVLSAKHQAILEEERRKALDPAQRELEDKLQEREALIAEKQRVAEAQRAEQVGRAKQALSKAVIDTMQEFPESVRKNEALAHNVFEAWAYCVQHPDEAKELGIDVTPKGIAAAVRKRQKEIAQAMIAAAADDELGELVPESLAAKVLAKKKAAVEAAAHPSLTSSPQVRDGNSAKAPQPGRKRSALYRSITLGSMGLKE